MTKHTSDEAARGFDPDNIPDEGGAALHTTALVATGLTDGNPQTLVYPGPGEQADTARALNEAASALGLGNAVQWSGDHFVVPAEVADKAKLGKAATAVDTEPVNMINPRLAVPDPQQFGTAHDAVLVEGTAADEQEGRNDGGPLPAVTAAHGPGDGDAAKKTASHKAAPTQAAAHKAAD